MFMLIYKVPFTASCFSSYTRCHLLHHVVYLSQCLSPWKVTVSAIPEIHQTLSESPLQNYEWYFIQYLRNWSFSHALKPKYTQLKKVPHVFRVISCHFGHNTQTVPKSWPPLSHLSAVNQRNLGDERTLATLVNVLLCTLKLRTEQINCKRR
jgi:hypothetical protein